MIKKSDLPTVPPQGRAISQIDKVLSEYTQNLTQFFVERIEYLKSSNAVSEEEFSAAVKVLVNDIKLLDPERFAEASVASKEQIEIWLTPGNAPLVIPARNPILIALYEVSLDKLAEEAGDLKGRMVCLKDMIADYN